MHANIKPYDMLSAMLNEIQCSLTSLINRSKEDTIQIKDPDCVYNYAQCNIMRDRR